MSRLGYTMVLPAVRERDSDAHVTPSDNNPFDVDARRQASVPKHFAPLARQDIHLTAR